MTFRGLRCISAISVCWRRLSNSPRMTIMCKMRPFIKEAL
jgi:hypothetical protein